VPPVAAEPGPESSSTAKTDRSRQPDPNSKARFTGGENAADVKDVLREQSGATPIVKWIAAGVVAVLIAGMVYTARRRRRAREA
jgi:hypothetical protein